MLIKQSVLIMKKLFILMMMISFFGKMMSQTERYIYQTEVNPDTVNLVDPKVERTFLDIKSGKSLFISENKLLRDSLTTVLKLQEKPEKKKSKKEKPGFPKLANGKTLQPTFFDYFIIKNLSDKSVQFVENIGYSQIFYTEDRKMNWNILQEYGDYNGYKTQKATMTFGGRVWTAWFAPEIKVFDGPYKFSDLPGLIVKLEDDKGDYRFSFVKKIALQNSFSEDIKPDARKSTRINFQGDKASIRMEMAKNKDSEIDLDHFSPSGGRGMHQRNSGTNDGFGGQPGMNGEKPNGQMEMDRQRDGQMGNPNSRSQININMENTNPIELNNR